MPIPVTCPSCLARFTVSDKYAGKQGPCPKCKQVITVPDKSQEVVIHAPETSGPKDSAGRPVLKPLRRVEFTVSTAQIIVASVLSALCLFGALGARATGSIPPTWALALVAVGLAYPLAAVGYTFFKDDELGGYIGKERWIRLGICAGVFAFTWAMYWGLAWYFGNRTLADVDALQLIVFVALMFAAGIGASIGACELEVSQSFLHYAMYFAATVLLALIAGVPLAEPILGGAKVDEYGIPKQNSKILLPPESVPVAPSEEPTGQQP